MTEKRIQAAAVRALCGDISDMTLWRWINARGFPEPVYIARRRFWRESDVIEWLDAQASLADERDAKIMAALESRETRGAA